MTDIYNAHAEWHVRNLGLRTFTVNHEELTTNAIGVISDLAEFLGCSQQASIRNAKALVGKRRARIQHYIKKVRHPSLLIDGLRKTTRHFSS
jgi:hypothetical protein